MIETVERSCPFCKNNKGKIIFRSAKFGIRRCRTCLFMYTVPCPDKDLLNRIYENLYSLEQKNDKGVLKWYYRDSGSTFEDMLQKILKLKTGGKLLDVGCNYGLFLKMARDAGFEVCGIDSTDAVVRYAQEELGLDVRKAALEEAKFPDNSFEVITMFEVLEHVEDPLKVLREARRILKEDGVLFLTVPNTRIYLLKGYILPLIPSLDCCKGFYTAGITLNEMGLPLHLNHFTPLTVKKILRGAGFNSIKFDIGQARNPWRCNIRIFLRAIYFKFSRMLFQITKIHLYPQLVIIARKQKI